MRIARNVALLLLLAPAAGASEPVLQDEDKKRIEELEKQVAELTRRVKTLEEQNSARRGTGGAPDPGAAALAANERIASSSLKTLATAEADFKANDRDGNGSKDFWVGDVSGLYRYTAANNREIKLIDKSLADADAAPLKNQNLSALKREQPLPKTGYLFAVLPKYVDKEKTENYHSGGFRHSNRFGFAAYPVDYGKSGRYTFIVNESNTVWKKDLGGKPPEMYPESPSKDEWEKSD